MAVLKIDIELNDAGAKEKLDAAEAAAERDTELQRIEAEL